VDIGLQDKELEIQLAYILGLDWGIVNSNGQSRSDTNKSVNIGTAVMANNGH